MEILGVAGSSLGGARPKATVLHDDGSLWMVKLPSNLDRRADIEAWEAVALGLAQGAGLAVPRFSLLRVTGHNASLLVERFDRAGNSRVGYISAMTAMGIGPLQQQRATYEDLADAVDVFGRERSAAATRADLRELFGRVALSVLVGNVDDHWKNHGFVRSVDGTGWRLSPVFDINPSRPTRGHRGRSLSARDGSGERDIRVLIQGADAYSLTEKEAAAVIDKVVTSVEGWRERAQRHGIAPAEIQHMAPAFSETQMEHAKAFLAETYDRGERNPEVNSKDRTG